MQTRPEPRKARPPVRFDLFLCFLLFMAGLLVGERWDIGFGALLWVSAAALAAGFGLLATGRRGVEAALTLLVVAAGIISFRIELDRVRRPPPPRLARAMADGGEITVEGIVLSGGAAGASDFAPDQLHSRFRLLVQRAWFDDGSEAEELGVELVGVWSPAGFGLEPGDRVRVRGAVRERVELANFGRTGLTARLGAPPGAGIIAARRADAVELLGRSPTPGALTVLRRRIHELFDRGFASDRIAALAETLVFGRGLVDYQRLDPERRKARDLLFSDFNRAGISYLLVVSGLHVSAVIGIFFLLSVRLWRFRWAAAALVAALMIFYVAVTGGRLPAMRALIMGAVLILYLASGRGRNWPNALGAAGLIILAADPLALHAPSFALSFGAMAGIVFAYPALRRIIPGTGLWPVKTLAFILSVQLAIMPLLAYYFGSVTAACIFLNFLALPLTAVLIPAGLLGALAGLAQPWLAAPMFAVLGLGVRLLDAAASLAGRLEFLQFNITITHWAALAGCYAVAAGAVALMDRDRSRRAPAVIACWALVLVGLNALVWPGAVRRMDRRLVITVLDVWQGDAVAIRTPEGRGLLIDAGPARFGGADMAELIRMSFMKQGIGELDAVFLTHADADHIGGVLGLVDRLRVRELMHGFGASGKPSVLELKERAASAGIRVRGVHAGTRIEYGSGVVIETLWPPAERVAASRIDHDNSISLVIRLEYGDFCAMFMGDVGFEAELALLAGNRDLGCHVLKVGHHGSATASHPAFIRAVSPAVAVFSAGKYNVHGHPTDRARVRLLRAGAETFSTHKHGAVRVRTGGKGFEVVTARGPTP